MLACGYAAPRFESIVIILIIVFVEHATQTVSEDAAYTPADALVFDIEGDTKLGDDIAHPEGQSVFEDVEEGFVALFDTGEVHIEQRIAEDERVGDFALRACGHFEVAQ